MRIAWLAVGGPGDARPGDHDQVQALWSGSSSPTSLISMAEADLRDVPPRIEVSPGWAPRLRGHRRWSVSLVMCPP
jgi:hypothetical protein